MKVSYDIIKGKMRNRHEQHDERELEFYEGHDER